MSRTIERLRRQGAWADPRATIRAWMRGVATVILLTFMTASPGGATTGDWVLQALLSDDAATVETAVSEFLRPLGGGEWAPGSVDTFGVWFREDFDLSSWVGEVLAKGRPEARELVSGQVVGMLSFYMAFSTPEMLEFAAVNHRSAKEMFEGWPGYFVDWVPTMEHLRSREDGGHLLTHLPESVGDDEARRLALAFASQMRRVQAALPRLLEDEYDRRQLSGTIGSDETLDLLLQSLAFLQEYVGTEATRAAAWAEWMKGHEARGLPTRVVGVESPWNLFPRLLAESGFAVEGRTLPLGIRRVALALAAEPRTELRHDERLEAAVSLLANERPLAEETGRRIFDIYCGSLDGHCLEKLNLLYAGPDDPSLRSVEADVGRRVVESLAGLVEEKERQCGVLAESEAETTPAANSPSDPDLPARWRVGSIGEELQEVLALVERLDTVPRPVLDGVFEFWSTERFPEARRILEEHDWLGPDVAAVTSAQREGLGDGPSPRRRIGVAELCEGRI